MSRPDHRRKADAARRVLSKAGATRAARKADTKALRRAAKWVNRRGEK